MKKQVLKYVGIITVCILLWTFGSDFLRQDDTLTVLFGFGLICLMFGVMFQTLWGVIIDQNWKNSKTNDVDRILNEWTEPQPSSRQPWLKEQDDKK